MPARLLPQLTDSAERVAFAKTLQGLVSAVLVPNLKGAARAFETGADALPKPGDHLVVLDGRGRPRSKLPIGSGSMAVAAMRLRTQDRYAAAYGRLMALADEGHVESARMALVMLRFGSTVYRSQWSASTVQVEHWLALANRPTPTIVAGGGD